MIRMMLATRYLSTVLRLIPLLLLSLLHNLYILVRLLILYNVHIALSKSNATLNLNYSGDCLYIMYIPLYYKKISPSLPCTRIGRRGREEGNAGEGEEGGGGDCNRLHSNRCHRKRCHSNCCYKKLCHRRSLDHNCKIGS